jgi:uncharacterized membrane protein
MHARREAQTRVDRILAFRQQLAELERDSVLELTPGQREKVDAHLDQLQKQLAREFDVDVTTSQRQLSAGMKVASALGALALCAGVFLFFYRFWGVMTTGVQVALVIVTPLLLIAAMEFASRRERTRYFTAMIGLVAVSAFVVNLMMLGQIFNVAPSPNALLVWGAFALILAHAYRVRWLVAAGVAGVCGWFAGSMLVWFLAANSIYGQERLESSLLPASLAVAFGARRNQDEFSPAYRLSGLIVGFIALLVLSFGAGSYLPGDQKTIARLYQFAGLAAAAATIWLGIRKQWSGTLNTGAAFFAIFLLARLVDWFWDWMPTYIFFLVIGAIAMGLLALFRKLRTRLEAA